MCILFQFKWIYTIIYYNKPILQRLSYALLWLVYDNKCSRFFVWYMSAWRVYHAPYNMLVINDWAATDSRVSIQVVFNPYVIIGNVIK